MQFLQNGDSAKDVIVFITVYLMNELLFSVSNIFATHYFSINEI